MSHIVNLGLLTVDEYVARRSSTLLQDPHATLDENHEIMTYLSKLDSAYISEIKELAATQLQPLSKNIRMIITIIAYGEGKRIRKTLDNYPLQDLPHDQFEIIILDNHPESVERDNTQEEVENFKIAHPLISVVYAHKIWKKGEYATVGNARKHVFDIALTRIQERGGGATDTILISNDADTLRFETNYLSSILQEFDSQDSVDALGTPANVPFTLIQKPHMYATFNFWDALDEAVFSGEPANLRGVSSAFRASSYSAVGGYNPKAIMAEDLEIGWFLADARNWNPNSVILFKKTKCIQDPRRILMAVANRTPIYEMFAGFVSNPEIRDVDNDVLLSRIPDQLDWEQLEEELNGFWRWRNTGMYKWKQDVFPESFQYAMDKIGVEYEIINNQIRIKKLDQLLLNYQSDFGNTFEVIHSEPRAFDERKQEDIAAYYSSISDGAIAARKA